MERVDSFDGYAACDRCGAAADEPCTTPGGRPYDLKIHGGRSTKQEAAERAKRWAEFDAERKQRQQERQRLIDALRKLDPDDREVVTRWLYQLGNATGAASKQLFDAADAVYSEDDEE